MDSEIDLKQIWLMIWNKKWIILVVVLLFLVMGCIYSYYFVMPEYTSSTTLILAKSQGDTDGMDSNGNLYINGGTINITGQSPFDYDGEAKYNGGTIIVNGETTNTITSQMMGGGMGGPNGMNMQDRGMPNGGNMNGRGRR